MSKSNSKTKKLITTKYWNKHYSQQNNNPEEEILRIAYSELSKRHGFRINTATHYEFCGPTAVINAYDAVRKPFYLKVGNYEVQPEGLLSSYLRDPINYTNLTKVTGIDVKITPANRVLLVYPYACKELFNWNNVFYMKSKPKLKQFPTLLEANNSFVIQLKEPSHYVAIVGYDVEKKELIYNDPWNYRGGIHGLNRRMSEKEFNNNVHEHALRVGGY